MSKISFSPALSCLSRASLVGLLALAAACSSFPQRKAGEDTFVVAPATSGTIAGLSEYLNPRLGEGESAYWLIEGSQEALDSRLALLDEAVSSIDMQYFIWEDDASGRLLLRRLIHAADRGVRVRLLMDDITTAGRDNEYQALDSHPNINVRYFNPWNFRFQLGRITEFMFRFGVLNHRLHNKTIIADGQLGMIGGRNIGNRYFGLYDVFVQNDLDILFAGPVINDVEADFDRYWNARDSHDLDLYLERQRTNSSLEYLRSYTQSVIDEHEDLLQSFPSEPVRWDAYFDELKATWEGGSGVYVYDLPAIRDEHPAQLYDEFKALIGTAEREVMISSAYFVPDDGLLELMATLVARGVRVVVFTNSLETNNHTLAHVAYRQWRKDLLEAGIEIYELMPRPEILSQYEVPPVRTGFMGLHAKAVVVDESVLFVGTPNVDPRAMLINTENAIIIESEALAEQLRQHLLTAMSPANSWRVRLDERGNVNWVGRDEIHTRQPASGFGLRLKQFFLSLLPLRKQA